MSDARKISQRLEDLFHRIRRERMLGLPFLNPALEVAAVGFHRWQGCWLGVMLTPWSMNLLLLPVEQDDHDFAGAVGDKRSYTFPSGDYEFILAGEPELGPYAICSLFSPVSEFIDQASALATAEAALHFLFEAPEVSADAGVAVESVPSSKPRGITRRELLRGCFRGAPAQADEAPLTERR